MIQQLEKTLCMFKYHDIYDRTKAINYSKIRNKKDRILLSNETGSSGQDENNHLYIAADKKLYLADIVHEQIVKKLKLKYDITCIVRSSPTRLACGTKDGVVYIIKVPELKIERELHDPHSKRCVSAIMPLSSTSLVSVTGQSLIQLWDCSISCCTLLNDKFIKHDRKDWVLCLVQLSNARYMISGGYDNKLRMWDIENGSCLAEQAAHSSLITCIIEFASGYVLSGSWDTKIHVWKIDNLSPTIVGTLNDHTGGIKSMVKLSSPNNNVVTASWDNTIRIWNLTIKADSVTGEVLKIITLTSGVFNICNVPSGRFASSHEDGTIQVWDFTGNSLKTFKLGCNSRICTNKFIFVRWLEYSGNILAPIKHE
jgi:WD40 repeat protein